MTIESLSISGARLSGSGTFGMGERVQVLFEVDGAPIDVTAEVVPPLPLQSSSGMSMKPLPVHPFLPAQSFAGVLHAPLPEQSLTPMQCTFAVFSPVAGFSVGAGWASFLGSDAAGGVSCLVSDFLQAAAK